MTILLVFPFLLFWGCATTEVSTFHSSLTKLEIKGDTVICDAEIGWGSHQVYF
jgi:hypothetical protein